MYTFASSASKKLSESVVGTAQTLKKSVEEGKLTEIIDKVMTFPFVVESTFFLLNYFEMFE